MSFDLNLLLTFEALDLARSVSGAARHLGLSQPATSAALSRLRRAFGDDLFTYAGGSMQPTPMARRLAPGIHSTLAAMRGLLEAERQFVPEVARTSFTVGVTDYASAVIAPRLIARLALQAPGIDLRLQAYDKAMVGGLIDGGVLDIAIGSFADPPDRSVATVLFGESFVGVARSEHPALAAQLDAASFACLDHALFTLGRDGRGAVDDALAAIGLERRVRVALPHLMALPEILRATDLVAAVPKRAAARFGAGLSLFSLDFLGLMPWTMHMLWSPSARKDPANAWLRESVKELCLTL
ncbi:LysR family transcriptional regulator [Tabrizicola piscis]|uniref:LysR family transcriptional regulator n=1 Tax=Tabrizicola piscis TaxID=2494374 RepID=UPI0013DDFC47|nr:LysR family transcriptional regulator [Tabrizicola piscis]